MDKAPDILFNYLRDAIYAPKKAVLNVEELPDDFQDLGHGLTFFVDCVAEITKVMRGMSKGQIDVSALSRENELAAPLKSLVASMKHLTWQSQRIAQGDYSQRVDFMGEFSEAFNQMTTQLAERQRNLEEKIYEIQKKSISLEHSNRLLVSLMEHVPHQIIVIEQKTRKILVLNESAFKELSRDSNYLPYFMQKTQDITEHYCGIEIEYIKGETLRYFEVNSYLIDWDGINAKILVIEDISKSKFAIKELEIQVYQDDLTHLYNRAYGMKVLDEWVARKRKFVVIFSDLDHLKYVNDEFGHAEGDLYIINAGKHLKTFSSDSIVCRFGGDEFMLLAADIDYDTAHEKMQEIYDGFKKDKHLHDKEFVYSISYGIVAIGSDNNMLPSEILIIADENMYSNKRMRKKARQQEAALKASPIIS